MAVARLAQGRCQRMREGRRMNVRKVGTDGTGTVPVRSHVRRGPDDVRRSMDGCTKCGICQAHCPVAAATDAFPGPKYAGPQAQRFRVIGIADESTESERKRDVSGKQVSVRVKHGGGRIIKKK